MTAPRHGPGPFRADQLPEEGRYELTRGHPVYCAPAGGQHGGRHLVGALPLATDPAVTEVGLDVGHQLAPDTVRAPDVSVGNVPSRPGWVAGAPPLALEYADRGQDEGELRDKIRELLAAGTKYVWVVRLSGPRRVEVHEAGRAMQTVLPGQSLRAPGVLQNAVALEALYDPEAAREAALRNLLQRQGYADVDAIRAEGKSESLLQVLHLRGIALTGAERDVVGATRDEAVLARWLRRALTATTAEEVFSGEEGT